MSPRPSDGAPPPAAPLPAAVPTHAPAAAEGSEEAPLLRADAPANAPAATAWTPREAAPYVAASYRPRPSDDATLFGAAALPAQAKTDVPGQEAVLKTLVADMQGWMQGMEERLAAKYEALRGMEERVAAVCEAGMEANIRQWVECRELLQSLDLRAGDAPENDQGARSDLAKSQSGSKVDVPQTPRTSAMHFGRNSTAGSGDAWENCSESMPTEEDSEADEDVEQRVRQLNHKQAFLEDAIMNSVLYQDVKKFAHRCKARMGEPNVNGLWYRVATSTWFSLLCLVATLGMCVAMAIDTDSRTRRALAEALGYKVPEQAITPEMLEVVRLVFVAWLLMEMSVNLLGERGEFFCGHAKYWNLFDFLILTLSLADLLMDGPSLNFVRFVRVARSSRMLRAVRFIRHSTNLQKIIRSLGGVISSLFWTLVLSSMLAYVVGLSMMEAVTSFVSGEMQRAGGVLRDERYSLDTFFAVPWAFGLVQDMDMYYGGLGRTLITLYRGISGADWSSFAAPLARINIGWGVVWLLYICLVMFGVLNLLTGNIVNLMKRPVPNEIAKNADKDARDEHDLAEFLHQELGVLGKPKLTKKSFWAIIHLESAVRKFAEFGIDISRLSEVYDLILQGDRNLTPELVARRCIVLRGEASARGQVALRAELQHIKRKLQDIQHIMVGAAAASERQSSFNDDDIVGC